MTLLVNSFSLQIFMDNLFLPSVVLGMGNIKKNKIDYNSCSTVAYILVGNMQK